MQGKDVRYKGANVSLTANNSTYTNLSNTFKVNEKESKNFLLTFTLASGTYGGNVSYMLQHSFDASTWEAVFASGTDRTVAADGVVTIRLNIEDSTDQDLLPLRPFVRLVYKTAAATTATMTNCTFLHLDN